MVFERRSGGYGGRPYGERRPYGDRSSYGERRPFRREERQEEQEETPSTVEEMPQEIKIVFPGDVLAEGMELLPGYGAYREGNVIYAKIIGVLKKTGSVVSVIPLTGVYVPKRWDWVIGEIKDISFSNWTVDINSPYEAQLSVMETKEFIPKGADISKFYDSGDLIFTKVSTVTSTKFVNISMYDPKARKLVGGLVVNITPAKVPRLIGHGGSMITIIKDKTNCNIYVGQNGRVWIKGDFEDLAAEAVEMVNQLSHVSGLTDKISAMLDEKLKARGVTPTAVVKKVEEAPAVPKEDVAEDVAEDESEEEVEGENNV